MTAARDRIKDILVQEDRFLITAHANPDGDALGSMAALGHMLERLGKSFLLYNHSGLPEHLAWLDLPGPVHDTVDAVRDFEPRRSFILDCGDLPRAGDALPDALDADGIINIDHHPGNPLFGAVNWVDPTYAAVGEMLAELTRELSLDFSGGLGESLYLAMVTDTGHFSYGNTRPETLELCAEIVRQGLDPGVFGAKLDNQWSLGRLQLWSLVFGSVELHCDGKAAVMRVSDEDFARTGTTKADVDGLANYGRRVKGVQVSAILREDEPGCIKFSLRSSGPVNVQKVAAFFGGGGHRNASGGTIQGNLDDAEDRLLAAMDSLLHLSGDPR